MGHQSIARKSQMKYLVYGHHTTLIDHRAARTCNSSVADITPMTTDPCILHFVQYLANLEKKTIIMLCQNDSYDNNSGGSEDQIMYCDACIY